MTQTLANPGFIAASAGPLDALGTPARIRTRHLLLAMVPIVLVALQAFYWTGPVASDDVGYWRLAKDPSLAAVTTGSAQTLARVMMWLPLRISIAVVGEHWRALLVWPLLASNLAVVLVGVAAWRWWGPAAAIVAMLTLGLVPLHVTSATVFLPDGIGAMFTAGALLLAGPALLGAQVAKPLLRAFLAGLVIGLGFSAKETVGLLYPSLALFVLIGRTRCRWAWARLAAIAAGGAVCVGADAGVMWTLTGDPLFHLRAMQTAAEAYGSPLTDTSWRELYWYLTEYVRWLAHPASAFGGWGLVYLAAAAWALVRPTAWRMLLLCCLLVPGLYLTVGTINVWNYTPIYHQPRYLLPLLPIGALLVTDAAVALWRCRRGPAVVILLAVVLGAGSLVWPDRLAGQMYHAGTFGAARAILAEGDLDTDHDAPVYASPSTAFRLALLSDSGELPEIRVLKSRPRTPAQWQTLVPGGYVWVTAADRSAADDDRAHCLGRSSYDALKAFECVARSGTPPSRLILLLAGSNARRSTSAGGDAVEVYYVSPAHREPRTSVRPVSPTSTRGDPAPAVRAS